MRKRYNITRRKPLFFLDYYATSNLKTNIAYEVLKGVSKGCKLGNISLIGGETAEMPGIYKKMILTWQDFVWNFRKKGFTSKKN